MRMITETQMQHAEDDLIDQFVDQLFLDVRSAYPQKLSDHNDTQLKTEIKKVVIQMRERGLKRKATCYHYVGICIDYGWDFIDQPGNVWMHDQFLNNLEYGTLAARIEALFHHGYKQLVS